MTSGTPRVARLAGLLLGALLVGSCGTAATVAPAPPPVQEQPAAGVVRLAGDVREPRDLRVDELARLPQQTVTVQSVTSRVAGTSATSSSYA